MKKSILTFGLIIWAVSAMFADDATIQKQLVGKWQSTDGQETLKENGVVTCLPNDCGSSYRWNVQNGMFHQFYDVGHGQTRKNTYAKIIELSKTKFVNAVFYFGRSGGQGRRGVGLPVGSSSNGWCTAGVAVGRRSIASPPMKPM